MFVLLGLLRSRFVGVECILLARRYKSNEPHRYAVDLIEYLRSMHSLLSSAFRVAEFIRNTDSSDTSTARVGSAYSAYF
jgi:hypothetical protein